MNLFYLKHHYLSIVRSKSFTGEVIAFIVLFVLFRKVVPIIYDSVDALVVQSSRLFHQDSSFKLFLLLFFSSDLLMKMVLKRPTPKTKYYLLWTDKTSQIAWQYIVTSFFGVLPFLMIATFVPVFSKTFEYLGSDYLLIVSVFWICTFLMGLAFQYANRKARLIVVTAFVLIGALMLADAVSAVDVSEGLFTLTSVLILLPVSSIVAFVAVKFHIEKRTIQPERKGLLSIDRTFVKFKNPLFQLEWALIARNKRTRSNLLMGLLSIAVFPFLLDEESPEALIILLSLFSSSFFIIQHGVYSLGWEGSYFDFLVTSIPVKRFLENRYLFYAATCMLGFLLFLIPTIINKLEVELLVSMLLYNIGITIPLVLYRSVFNSTKIELSENSFMNYSGMVTGPIMVTSVLVFFLPFMIYGLSKTLLGDYAAYGLGLVGLLGLLMKSVFIQGISSFMSRKKYHLSQSFKS